LVEEFDLHGCPIYFDLVGKQRDPMRGSRGGGNAAAEVREAKPKWKIAESSAVMED
jgi:hypothetical protein